MLKQALVLVAIMSFAVLASAQSVHLRGKIEDAENVCYYCPGIGFVIDCNYTPVSSTVYDLNQYIGLQVELDGVWNGSYTSPSVEITSMTVVPESFTIGGNARIGNNVDYTVQGTPGDLAYNFFSLGTSFLPVGSNLIYLLDPVSSTLLNTAPLDSNGEFTVTGLIPNLPSIVGVTIYGQGAIVPQNGAPAYMTNPDCKEIRL